MTKLLINLVKNKKSKSERAALSSLSGAVGIICNIILFAVKLTVGNLTASISITADAINNLSDSASNIVSLMGTKLSGKPDDKEHPFGHGRVEYISALIVAVIIFLMSFELLKSSVGKIIHPTETKYSIALVMVLLITVLIKLWMAFFNKKLFKLTNNLNLKAVGQDSINDCIATLSTIAAMVLSGVFHINRIDGIIGVGVSVFIFISGVQILKSVLGPLIGEPPSKELCDRIEDIILESDIVLGVHDLIVHSYGEGRIIASAHAEVSSNEDIITVHNEIDRAEKRILNELNIVMCIHMDPVTLDDIERKRYRKITKMIISNYNKDYSFHDFRVIGEADEKRLEFDLIIPFDDNPKTAEIKSELESQFAEICPEIKAEINIENSYV